MNFFEDAVRFFSNMKKEASAKHILISGPDAVSKLSIIKGELVGAEDLSEAFSVLAAKVNHPVCMTFITVFRMFPSPERNEAFPDLPQVQPDKITLIVRSVSAQVLTGAVILEHSNLE
jgi:hypothetical protein